MYSWVNIHALFPGMKGLFVHAVNIELNELTGILDEHRFKVIIIDGRKIINEQSFFEIAAQSFHFPDYFGHNWAAWADCLGDFGQALPANRVAIIWKSADFTMSHDLQVFLEALFDLINLATGVSLHALDRQKEGSDTEQIEIFVLGDGSGFQKVVNLSVSGN